MPSAKVISSLISLNARLTILVPVLAISAGKDTKLPIGNFLPLSEVVRGQRGWNN